MRGKRDSGLPPLRQHSQGRQAATRLIPDPVTAPVVAQIFDWRVLDRLGMNTIANRLNANPAKYPPPGRSGCWQVSVIARIPGNPKYTGYIVYGRTQQRTANAATKPPPSNGSGHPNSPTPPSSAGRPGTPPRPPGPSTAPAATAPARTPTPATTYNYPLRGIIRCRICKRRMTGRRKLGRRGQITRYYQCTHDTTNPRHVGAHPEHPASVLVREDLMQAISPSFFDTRVFGRDRARLLAAAMPATANDAASRREQDTVALAKRLERIDAAENARAREIEHLATLPADSPAFAALRTRILARFTELEDERAAINTRLAQLAATAPAVNDPALLDRLPQIPGILHCAPAELLQELYRLFGAQMIYNHEDNQVSCYATITAATTRALTTPLLASRDASAIGTVSAPLLHAPIATAAEQRPGWIGV